MIPKHKDPNKNKDIQTFIILDLPSASLIMEISSTISSEELNRKLIDFTVEVRPKSSTSKLFPKVNCRLTENCNKDIFKKIFFFLQFRMHFCKYSCRKMTNLQQKN